MTQNCSCTPYLSSARVVVSIEVKKHCTRDKGYGPIAEDIQVGEATGYFMVVLYNLSSWLPQMKRLQREAGGGGLRVPPSLCPWIILLEVLFMEKIIGNTEKRFD
jgi:hypothetical protein